MRLFWLFVLVFLSISLPSASSEAQAANISVCANRDFTAISDKLALETFRQGISLKMRKITVIRAEQANAYALSDGSIVFTTAILDQIKSFNELAAIYLHEVGHLELGHLQKENNNVENLVDLFFSQGATSLFGLLGKAQFSQLKEIEADEFAMTALGHLGIDPRALSSSFGDTSTKSTSDLDYFQTHPTTLARKERVISTIGKITIKKNIFGEVRWTKLFPWQCS